jgi:hypothetical protein
MKKLPDFEEIRLIPEKVPTSVNASLDSTENVLKRLLLNIEAFKKIENENTKLRDIILKNQSILKQDYKKKLDTVTYALKEKDALTGSIKKDLFQKYKRYADLLTRQTLNEREKNNLLKKKYMELILVAKKISDDNKNLRLIILHNQDILKNEFEKRLKHLDEELKGKQLVETVSHKALIKEHEDAKLELKRLLFIEKKRKDILEKKNKDILLAMGKAFDEAKRLQSLNRKLIQRLAFLEKKSLANEQVLYAETELIKKAFENKLKEVIKLQLSKEIDYKAKIDSLSKDLAKYYEELKTSKVKYYNREKDIKEKIKAIFG